MHFTELFIRRPVMTTLIMLAILMFGAMSYRYLPVSDLPNVDFPTILVSAELPGASPLPAQGAQVPSLPVEDDHPGVLAVQDVEIAVVRGDPGHTLCSAADASQ